jgi:hypothetical protein
LKNSFLFAVIFESSCLKLPAAAFLGFAKSCSPFFALSMLIFSKSAFFITTSPRISIKDFSSISSGIEKIVFALFVTSSPTVPSPLVIACFKIPFS